MSNLIITIIAIALVAVAAAMGLYYGGEAFMDSSAQAAANQMISDAQGIAAAFQVYAAANDGTTATPINAPQQQVPCQMFPCQPQQQQQQVATLGDTGNDFSFLVYQQYLTSLPGGPPAAVLGTGPASDGSGYYCMYGSYDYENATACGANVPNGTVNGIANNGTPVIVSLTMNGSVSPGSIQSQQIQALSGATNFQKLVCQKIADKARGVGAPIDTTYFIDSNDPDYSSPNTTPFLFDCAAEDPNIGTAGAYDFAYRIM